MSYRLRPAKDRSYSANNKWMYRDSISENENIIFNIKKLEDLFSAFAHNCEASDCVSVNINIVQR